jgi:rod shape-determining protein MreD
MKKTISGLTRPLRSGRDYQSRIEQVPSPTKMLAIPVASILLGSVFTTLPILTTQAILPPFGFMMFVAWRLFRPRLLPMWAGLPFGMFDDLFSGQPFGSGALIWSLAMLAIELLDARAVWRDYWQDWLFASILIMLALCLGLFFVELVFTAPLASTLLPQIALSILLYPILVRIVARLDRWRLMP